MRGFNNLTKKDSISLKGTALDIYRLLLKTQKPLGIREIQRTLNLSSPSVAQYHLAKLENEGLLKREAGNYVVDKVLLDNCIKISRFIVPRYLFYSIFAIVAFLVELLFLRPPTITREYFFFISITGLFATILLYETAKIWNSDRL
jgi:predicted DNA-binding transcriptional regulator